MTRCERLLNTLNERNFPVIIKKNKILVSIIVLNRNGIKHLQTLIPALMKHTKGINYELIIVDNASSDNSVAYIKNHIKNIPLQLIQNDFNESFSAANNKAVEVAKGEYIVLLNNDIEPLAGWLNYLFASLELTENVGSVGARLVYPEKKESLFTGLFKKQHGRDCKIQHSGVAFNYEGMQYRPFNLGKGKSFDDPAVLDAGSKSALTAACLLIPKDIYLQVGGLDEVYNYGGEDVDFGLKLLKAGYKNYYCPDSVLLHHEFGTQSKEKQVIAANRRKRNLKYFQSKWFLHIKKAYWTEKIYGKSNLYAESPLTIAMVENKMLDCDKCIATVEKFGWQLISIPKKAFIRNRIKEDFDLQLIEKTDKSLVLFNKQHSFFLDKENWLEDARNALISRHLTPSIVIKVPAKTWKGTYSWGDYHMATLLQKELESLGHYVLLQIHPEWDNDAGLECDIAIVMRGVSRYAVKPQQLNIMWNISHPDDVSLEEYEEYDKVFIASEYWAKEISRQVSVPVEALLQCTDIERFREPNEREKSENHQQLLFVGNSRGVYRKILKDLLPTKYDLAIYGRRWEKILPKKLIKGEHILNDELYKHYGSTEILLNDHWDDMREKGFVSNRIFDGLACGAFILTDKVNHMGDLENFMGVYETAEELKEQLDYYLNHSAKRLKKAKKGMCYVKGNHTFKERAKVFSEASYELLQNRLDYKGI